MELSCDAVDSKIYKDEGLTVFHELQKYRFERIRQELNYSSHFDEKIKELILGHKKYILNELMKLSDRSDFGYINYHLELLLDSAWQMQNWQLGAVECDELLKWINDKEKCDNSDIIIQSLSFLKNKIYRIRALFIFMDVNQYDVDLDRSEIIERSYDFPLHSLLCCVEDFEDNELDIIDKRKVIMEKVEISLKDY